MLPEFVLRHPYEYESISVDDSELLIRGGDADAGTTSPAHRLPWEGRYLEVVYWKELGVDPRSVHPPQLC